MCARTIPGFARHTSRTVDVRICVRQQRLFRVPHRLGWNSCPDYPEPVQQSLMATERSRTCRCEYPGPRIHTETVLDIARLMNRSRYILMGVNVFLAVLLSSVALFTMTGLASLAWLIVAMIQLGCGFSQFWHSGRTINGMLVTAERMDDDAQMRDETEQRVTRTRELIDQLDMSTGSVTLTRDVPDVNSG
jgi:hypothetical protein